MLPYRTAASRKTGADGKLEISRDAAEAVQQAGSRLSVVLEGERAPGAISAVPCTCRAGGDRHIHYFLQSELLKALTAGREVTIDLGSEPSTVVVR